MIKILMMTLCLVAGVIYGETYYVSSSTGSDSNSGTSESSPWKTLNKINSFNFYPGDKILFKKGDSWTNSYLHFKESGTNSSPIILSTYGSGDKPIISAGNSFSVNARISGDYVILDGFHFKGWPTGSGYNNYPQGISLIGKNITVKNCIVEGNENGTTTQTVGIYIQGLYATVTNNEVMYWGRLIQLQPVVMSPCNTIISYNLLHDTRPLGYNDGDCLKIASSSGDTRGLMFSYNECYGWSNDGVDGRGKYLTIEYNVFHNPQHMVNSGIAFKRMSGVDEQSFGSIARYNIIRDWDAHDPLFSGGGAIITGSSQQRIYYNLIYNVKGHHGIAKDMISDDVEIFNNTIINTGGPGRHAINFQNNSKGSTNIKLKNNIIGGRGGESKDVHFGCDVISSNNVYVNNNISIATGVNVSQSSIITGTPSFIDVNSNNYRLSSSDTKAKNKGVVLSSIPQTDLDGNPVPFGSLPDIGAYEYIEGTTGGDNVNLNLKILLEGPFENGVMKTDINQANGLPLTQPYNTTPWNYSGNESVSSFNPDIVDWILIELRSGTSASTMVARKAALLKNTGEVVDLDGQSKVRFEDVSDGSYYVVVYHRNHLGVMSSVPVQLNENSNLYDFSSSPSSAYGNNALTDLGGGKWGLMAGDGDNNNVINTIDYGSVGNHLFEVGYVLGDFDMNGIINIIDYAKTYKNILKSSQVPN